MRWRLQIPASSTAATILSYVEPENHTDIRVARFPEQRLVIEPTSSLVHELLITHTKYKILYQSVINHHGSC